MKSRILPITIKCACGAPVTCHSDKDKLNRCDKCCSHGLDENHCVPVREIWICAHTKKCQWQGTHQDLIHIEDDPKHPGWKTGHCPKCNGKSFLLRNTKGQPLGQPL
jgi:hypothetical protein